jgi:hypothetical protein
MSRWSVLFDFDAVSIPIGATLRDAGGPAAAGAGPRGKLSLALARESVEMFNPYPLCENLFGDMSYATRAVSFVFTIVSVSC